MHNRLLAAFNGFKGTVDQFFPALGQYLYPHIIRDQSAFDQLTQKIVFNLAGSRKAYFDLLKAKLDQILKHLDLFLHDHRINQCLVSVTKVYAAPDRCPGDLLVWPLTFRVVNHRIFFVTFVIQHFSTLLTYSLIYKKTAHQSDGLSKTSVSGITRRDRFQ